MYSRTVLEVMKIDPFGFLKKLFGVALSVFYVQREDKYLLYQPRPIQPNLTLPYGGEERIAEEEREQPARLEQLTVHSMSANGKRRKMRKSVTPLVQPSERRFTRSCLRTDGYRPTPILAAHPKIKKSRAKNLLLPREKEAQAQEQEEAQENEDKAQVPTIPIAVLQRDGHALGIAADKLSKEKLEAAPGQKKDKESTDE
jgi:hypothetical protein